MDNKNKKENNFYENMNLNINIDNHKQRICLQRKEFINEFISKKRMNFSSNMKNSLEIKLENLILPNEVLLYQIQDLNLVSDF